jgi:RHS repeat-associated protein
MTFFRKPVRIENALNNVTLIEYNTQGNVSKFTNAENEATLFTYTAKGQLETITDPLSRVTRFTYDSNGNLLESTNPATETVTRTYDLANRLATVTDALNRTTQFTYDSLDRITEVRDAAQGLTKFAYDANDNVTSVTDPNNNPVERNLYDLRNRLIQKTDAKNLNTGYGYDLGGNLTSVTDRKGQVTTYTFDAVNRIASVTDQDGRATTYGYDLPGNLARISDTESGEILMSYDTLNRLTEVVTAQGTVQYAYDAIGRRISRTLSGGDVTTYTYDKANRVKTITLQGRTATYNYDLAGRLESKTLPNGINVAYQYDAADRVTSIAYTKPDATPIETVTYTYDVGGQRTQKALGGSALRETGFTATYDEANRLTSITLNGETFTVTYDNNGNLSSKSGPTSGTTTYTWNARNQLAAISGPAGSATFKYDALGRRIEKTINGNTTGFLYDGAQAIAELKGSAFDTVYHTGFAIDEVLARYGASGNKTLLIDALMSVIAQTNDAQSTDNFYAYTPYGEAQALGPDGGNSLQYTGRENDGTGLLYYRARYYDPVLKRFISEDPIGIGGGINLYIYVGGDPITYVDPNGEVGVAGAVIGGLLSGGFTLVNQLNGSAPINWWQVGAAAAGGAIAGASGAYLATITTKLLPTLVGNASINLMTNAASTAIGNLFACGNQRQSVSGNAWTGYWTGAVGGLTGMYLGKQAVAAGVAAAISGVGGRATAANIYSGLSALSTAMGNAVSNSNAFMNGPSGDQWY